MQKWFWGSVCILLLGSMAHAANFESEDPEIRKDIKQIVNFLHNSEYYQNGEYDNIRLVEEHPELREYTYAVDLSLPIKRGSAELQCSIFFWTVKRTTWSLMRPDRLIWNREVVSKSQIIGNGCLPTETATQLP